MAVMECPECQGKVSDTADACPHCGYSFAAEAERYKQEVKGYQKAEQADRNKAICLVLLALVVAGAFWLRTSSGKDFVKDYRKYGPFGEVERRDAMNKKRESKLTADVRYSPTKFIITNQDGFDWTSVELEINSVGLKSGYILKVGRISAGQTCTVQKVEFAKPDGTRFNPIAVKALNFSVLADTPNGKAASAWKLE